MIDFNFKNVKEVSKVVEENKELKEDLIAVEKFELAFKVYEFLISQSKIVKWSVALEKEEYNDEGRNAGVFAATTNNINDDLPTHDWSYDYEENSFIDNAQARKLSKILNVYFFKNKNENLVFPQKEYTVNDTGLKNFISDFIGKKYLKKWESAISKSNKNKII